jgi:type III secretory pathway component EscR
MKANMILSLLVLIILVSCSKDKFQTKPFIKIKSYNTKTIAKANGNELRIDINYTDKEGDLSQADFFAVRQRLNVKPLPANADKADTLRYQLPKFPDTDHGEIAFQIGWQDFLKESPSENDTLVFRFAVADRAGNKSDTITTSKLVILQ